MSRPVFQSCPIVGDTDEVRRRFLGDPGGWLPEPATPVDDHVWRIRLHAGPASHDVDATVDEPWWEGEMTWRLLHWEPITGTTLHRFLPAFAGELGLRVAEHTTVLVQGSYAPPGGPLGEAVDAVALHRVAGTTLNQLLVAIAKRLSPPDDSDVAAGDRGA